MSVVKEAERKAREMGGSQIMQASEIRGCYFHK